MKTNNKKTEIDVFYTIFVYIQACDIIMKRRFASPNVVTDYYQYAD